ncbi:MAG TPA: 2-oxoacid:ferredoxin oxidoreductase subunit beta [Bacteroidota bacterium]|jgi:2-oxoglutarate ferredoxin oxidoreductase subunit beta|nr:2-oxoacid:ferredoxin oxidoreductase subunit beta [Bacteroidota bacterium]
MKTRVQELIEAYPFTSEKKFTPKDYHSGEDVRWCPGCGDYSILAQTQRILSELGIPPHQIVFVSGIGCSSRFPYYMGTYGFHSIHGRAPAIASGLKLARPDLSVWVITGDGDGLSIGGNHYIHVLRRNIDLNILLFNNQIYALTKGQYSPTTERGKITKSSPDGVIDYPFNPIALALGAGGTFVARSIDRDQQHLQLMMKRAAQHKGTSLIEIYQNCVVFNDGVFSLFTEKETKDDSTIFLEHGKPLLFGKNMEKGIRLDGLTPEVVSLKDGKYSVSDITVYNDQDASLAFIIASMSNNSALPRPFGVFLDVPRPTYEEELISHIAEAQKKSGAIDFQSLLNSGDTWTIE